MKKQLIVAAFALVTLLLPNLAAAQQFGEWSAPVNLGAVVNSSANDQHPTISKDGLSLIFASTRAGGSGGFDLWVTQRESLDDPWQTPVNLGPVVNTSFLDFAPNLTTDGHWLFFHSNRPGGCGGNDLWATHRQNRRDDFGWETPINLGCVINTPFDEDGPTFFEDEQGNLFLYFARNLTPANADGYDMYVSACSLDLDTCNRTGAWEPAVYVAELSSAARDTRTAIRRRDGLEMFLTSNRPGGQGNLDLWVSTRASTSDPWSTPVDLAALNSSAADGAPGLSWDGTTMYFYSTRPGGLGGSDLYVTTRSKLAEGQ